MLVLLTAHSEFKNTFWYEPSLNTKLECMSTNRVNYFIADDLVQEKLCFLYF